MANLRDIRKRRKGAANTRKITRTMELVASAKLKKAQDAAAASRPYADGLRDLLNTIAAATGGRSSPHPLMVARPAKKVAILLLTADRGLAGAFNTNLIGTATARAVEHERAGRAVDIIAVGKKAASTLVFLGRAVRESHVGVTAAPTFAKAEKLANAAIERFLAAEYDLVEVVYSRFISPARQAPDLYTMLPAGQDGAKAGGGKAVAKADFIYEPEPEDLLATLIPLTVRSGLFSALLQTNASEHAARRVAMKNASDAAADMVKALSSAYNRGRQGKITQEIAEITGAVEAMA
ncbi:MAG: ATP synthase F1 subunit gamma [Planctomycetes bacterium]|nr:ATP synthase F1 subunit gamma [Planctomycetota bacterium]